MVDIKSNLSQATNLTGSPKLGKCLKSYPIWSKITGVEYSTPVFYWVLISLMLPAQVLGRGFGDPVSDIRHFRFIGSSLYALLVHRTV